MLAEEELLLPDSDPPDSEVLEPDIIEGLSLRMTQVMNHYQWEEHCCFMCEATDHFKWDCSHREAFHAWHKEHLNSKGAGPEPKVPTPKSPCRSKCVSSYNMLHHLTVCRWTNCTLGWPRDPGGSLG